MEIKQTKVLEKKHSDALISYLLKKDKKFKTLRIAFTIVGIFLILVSAYDIYMIGLYFWSVILGAFGIFFCIYYPCIYAPLLKRNSLKLSSGNIGKTSTITLNDDFIELVLDNETSKYTWDAIVAATDIGEYITLNANNARNLVLDKSELTEEEIKWILGYKERI